MHEIILPGSGWAALGWGAVLALLWFLIGWCMRGLWAGRKVDEEDNDGFEIVDPHARRDDIPFIPTGQRLPGDPEPDPAEAADRQARRLKQVRKTIETITNKKPLADDEEQWIGRDIEAEYDQRTRGGTGPEEAE